MQIDRAKLRVLADGLAALVAAVLPWSTSVTLIAIGLWFLVLLPTLRQEDLRDTLRHPAAYLPVALFAFAALGMLWADVSWKERLSGLYPYSRLLLIPVVFVQFRESERWRWVAGAFLASCIAVMLVSYVSILVGNRIGLVFNVPGIPARDYIAQAGEFTLCALGLLYLAMNFWSERKTLHLLVAVALALLFLTNVALIATSRTGLVSIPVLLALFAVTHFRLSHTLALLALVAFASAAIFFSSTTVQQRIAGIFTEVKTHRVNNNMETSAGLRIEFWRQALAIVRTAPIIGHGTGTVRDRYQKAVAAENSSAQATVNAHNQTLMVAIPLGIVGALILIAMWISHLALFLRGAGLAAWIGLLVVAQNILGGLFNTHLFDFVQGWLYIFGAGVMGGVVLARANVQAPDAGRS